MKYIRECPECGNNIEYLRKQAFNRANINKSSCKKCASIKRMSNPEAREKISVKTKGTNNPFYNKKHTKETKDNISKKIKNYYNDKDNPMLGKSYYDIWIEKYGIDKANHLLFEHKKKLSKLFSGENNPMFGKPSPHGSGNGWSGWYNDWFFRSLRELTYMIDVIEKNNLFWCSGEQKKFSIKYVDFNGNDRTYFSDFIIENKKMIEIKPKLLWKSKNVLLKKYAGEKFCETHDLVYELVDVDEILDLNTINQLYLKNMIIFTERYEKKFIDYLNK